MASKNPYLKPANVQDELTPTQIREYIKCARDPAHFIRNYVKVTHPTKGVVPFDLYGYQKDMIDLFQHNRNSIIMSARQTGKSTVSCAYLLWYACFAADDEPKTVLIISNKNAGAMEMINRIQFMYEHLPMWLKPGIDSSKWNKHTLAFENGSEIISQATTGSSGRGLSISLLFCLGGNTPIEVLDPDTGEILHLTMEELYNNHMEE